MKGYWVHRIGKFVLFAIAAAAVLGLVVMGLWNWLMPTVFGWSEIGFSQAVGLLILSKILFGGFRGHGGGGSHWRHRMQERWKRMTPEEREKFGAGVHGHGHCRHAAGNAEPQTE